MEKGNFADSIAPGDGISPVIGINHNSIQRSKQFFCQLINVTVTVSLVLTGYKYEPITREFA